MLVAGEGAGARTRPRRRARLTSSRELEDRDRPPAHGFSVASIAWGSFTRISIPETSGAWAARSPRSAFRSRLPHVIAGEYREYERFSTTVANAALRPIAGPYLASSSTRPPAAPVLTILQSDGTTATPRAAAAEPVRTVLSGPAGGALAASLRVVRGPARPLLDMGGLTDACSSRCPADDRRVRASLRAPMIEVRTVGAGGDRSRGGRAGAARRTRERGGRSGPACYGRARADGHRRAPGLGRLGARDLLWGALTIDARGRARPSAGARGPWARS